MLIEETPLKCCKTNLLTKGKFMNN